MVGEIWQQYLPSPRKLRCEVLNLSAKCCTSYRMLQSRMKGVNIQCRNHPSTDHLSARFEIRLPSHPTPHTFSWIIVSPFRTTESCYDVLYITKRRVCMFKREVDKDLLSGSTFLFFISSSITLFGPAWSCESIVHAFDYCIADVQGVNEAFDLTSKQNIS